ncbi:molybdenum ABC transporter ATP-binding protein [Rhodomicrobium sp. Az07]|uniref:molybdenum ABC transporter ATP-binding protein n=1 Tax=Rhodomicrobium sp. Az07 TaxID=2839034 RepID=UPI001BE63D96|nr:molybdenum ABC transporter ATP-binding protein [Rhodomicrobium sp. Az07]MBT3070894.1 molybdenum ABC transporter ATP-binding protein [Rhodomicrobium sp. Az07]
MIEVAVSQKLGAFALDVDFKTDGRFVALFGHSGSGKTTLINLIAGLTRPARGRIVIDGETLVDTARGIFVPACKRRLGMVFQEGRLFPHLSVKQNLLYGAWFAGAVDKSGAELARVAVLLGIDHLLTRYPNRLSGGEKQRVAIGRALLASPKLLLMDEPLASLDDARKLEIMPYLERLRDEAGIPIIYVSHSVAEVARLSDTLVVLSAGKMRACGPTLDLMQHVDLFPAAEGSDDAGALILATVVQQDNGYGLTKLSSRAGEWLMPRLDVPEGRQVRMQIKARDVLIAAERPDGMSALNVFRGVVAEIGATDGASVELRVDCMGETLIARLTRYSVERLQLAVGAPVFAIVKSVSFDRRTLGSGWQDLRASDAGAAAE